MTTRGVLGILVVLAIPVLIATTMRDADSRVVPAGAAISAAPAAGQSRADEPDEPQDAEETDETIPLASIPDVVLQAALAALPGLQVDAAECEHSASGVSYDLQGLVGDKRFEVAVSADGSVQEVEATDGD